MDNIAFRESISFAQMIAKPRSPYELCKTLGIEIITDKPIHKDGYLVCQEGYKLIFVSSKIQNFDRRKFVISHEIGHFLLHRDNLYCCSNVSEIGLSSINTSGQEYEANQFASEYLMPLKELTPLIPLQSLHFSDISQIADYFDVSMTFAALRAIRVSNTEDEILICYDGQKIKWFASADRTLRLRDIPQQCPIDLSKAPSQSDISGAWNSLYDGSVHQEIFNPFANQRLVLLSGNRVCEKEFYYEP